MISRAASVAAFEAAFERPRSGPRHFWRSKFSGEAQWILVLCVIEANAGFKQNWNQQEGRLDEAAQC
jgi:hypothetical protein